jgi:hypothetical protein
MGNCLCSFSLLTKLSSRRRRVRQADSAAADILRADMAVEEEALSGSDGVLY